MKQNIWESFLNHMCSLTVVVANQKFMKVSKYHIKGSLKVQGLGFNLI